MMGTRTRQIIAAITADVTLIAMIAAAAVLAAVPLTGLL